MDFRQAKCLRLEHIPGTCLGLTKVDPNTGKPVTDRQFDNVVKVPGHSREVVPFVASKLILHLVLAEEDGGREVEVPMYGFVRRFRPLTEPRRRALVETMLGSIRYYLTEDREGKEHVVPIYEDTEQWAQRAESWLRERNFCLPKLPSQESAGDAAKVVPLRPEQESAKRSTAVYSFDRRRMRPDGRSGPMPRRPRGRKKVDERQMGLF